MVDGVESIDARQHAYLVQGPTRKRGFVSFVEAALEVR